MVQKLHQLLNILLAGADAEDDKFISGLTEGDVAFRGDLRQDSAQILNKLFLMNRNAGLEILTKLITHTLNCYSQKRIQLKD